MHKGSPFICNFAHPCLSIRRMYDLLWKDFPQSRHKARPLARGPFAAVSVSPEEKEKRRKRREKKLKHREHLIRLAFRYR